MRAQPLESSALHAPAVERHCFRSQQPTSAQASLHPTSWRSRRISLFPPSSFALVIRASTGNGSKAAVRPGFRSGSRKRETARHRAARRVRPASPSARAQRLPSYGALVNPPSAVGELIILRKAIFCNPTSRDHLATPQDHSESRLSESHFTSLSRVQPCQRVLGCVIEGPSSSPSSTTLPLLISSRFRARLRWTMPMAFCSAAAAYAAASTAFLISP